MKIANSSFSRVLLLLVALAGFASVARATENGGSVWPLGSESYGVAAATGAPGQTLLFEYTCVATANEMDDANGKKIPLNFKVRVFAVAGELEHNWGVKFLGGQLESHMGVPFIYQHMKVGETTYNTENLNNINIVPFNVMYHKGDFSWLYELQFQTVAPGYQKSATPNNIGQHNTAMTPAAWITYAPHKGAQNFTLGIDYIVNNANHDTHYHSGNELQITYDAQQKFAHKRGTIGLDGFFYQQITEDKQNGIPVITTNVDGSKSVGYKGRVFDLGPQVTLPWGKYGTMIFKWDHDMLVQNKSKGDTFWFQFGIPFSYLHHVSKN